MERTTNKSVNATGQTKIFALRGVSFWLAQLILVLAVSVAAASEKTRFVPGRILVKSRAGVSETNLDNKLRNRGAISRRSLRQLNVNVVSVSEQDVDATLAALKNDPDIEFAERDYLAEAAAVPNDTLLGNEWHLAKIQALQAWSGTAGSSNVIVAVLDSGVNMSHPDLASQLLPGYDFVNSTTTITDDFGHGTAVIGTVAAAGNNGLGVAGVAFGCRVLPVKVMDSAGFAAYSTIAQGIHYAVDNGARIINLSIAGTIASQTLQDAVNYAWSKNAIVVAAAGNNSSSTPQYPASCVHAVAVSATASDDTLTWFSSFGTNISLSAPGDGIWTTQRNLDNAYGSWRGTSFASPVVAAVAALVISANPSLSNAQVVSLMEQNADDLGTAGYDMFFGYGRVNAFRAVSAASALPGAVTPMPTATPVVFITAPAAAQQFNFGTTLSLAASASPSSANGTVTSVTFFANGTPVAAASGTAASANWTPAQPGNYTLIAIATDDNGLNATSAPVSVSVVSVESVPPTINVTSAPKNGAQLTSAAVALFGTAADNVGVDHVEIDLNNSQVLDANGTASWSAVVNLAPGVNTLSIRSVDTAGNVSPAVNLTLTYVVTAPVTLLTNGWGRISPDLNGAQLQIGKTYTVKAVPGAAQAFAGWDSVGQVLRSQSATLTFVMQSNLVLKANFVPSPFPAVRGNYAGLAANTNAVSPESSGFFNLNVTPGGAFTGKLLIAGSRYGFRGQFDLAGNAAVAVDRGQYLSPLALTVHIDLTNGTDQVTGQLTDGAWTAAVNGDRNVFNSQYNPAQQAGLRNFILQRADNTSVEAGVGAGKISASGSANVAGALENGIKFHTATLLAKNGDCPFYLSLNNGSEVVIGWLNFPKVANPTASGTVLWVSTGTNTFAAQLQAASMP